MVASERIFDKTFKNPILLSAKLALARTSTEIFFNAILSNRKKAGLSLSKPILLSFCNKAFPCDKERSPFLKAKHKLKAPTGFPLAFEENAQNHHFLWHNIAHFFQRTEQERFLYFRA